MIFSCCLYELKVNVARSRIGCCCTRHAVIMCRCCYPPFNPTNKDSRGSQLTSAVNWKMVKRCTYVACNADSRYPERLGNTQFHPFPKPARNPEKCMKWISLCGRPQQQLCDKLRNHSTAKHIYVCSKVTVIHTAPFCSTIRDLWTFYNQRHVSKA